MVTHLIRHDCREAHGAGGLHHNLLDALISSLITSCGTGDTSPMALHVPCRNDGAGVQLSHIIYKASVSEIHLHPLVAQPNGVNDFGFVDGDDTVY